MTTEEIDAMLAGREMDNLIAEKVMGWRWWSGRGTGGPSYWETTSGEFAHSGGDEFSPSTDISAAWKVAESFSQGITLFRNIWANGDWHWHCHIGGSINDRYGEIWAEELHLGIFISHLLSESAHMNSDGTPDDE